MLRFLPLGLALGCVLLAAACSKDAPPPPELTVAEAQQSMKQAFDQAQPEVKQAAEALAQSLQGGQPVASFAHLQQLNGQASLTPEQRTMIARSQITVMKQLQEAAARGDSQASEVLETYNARK